MKTFVYLDTVIVNSYISQIHNGLITRKQHETSESIGESHATSSSTPESTTSFTAGLKYFNINGAERTTGTTSAHELSQHDYGKDWIEKVYHDNIVQELIELLSVSAESGSNTPHLEKDEGKFKVGDYVLFESEFDILDMNFFSDFFNDKDFEVMVESALKSPNPSANEGNREARRAADKKQHNQKKSDANDIKKMLRAMCKIMPCSKLIMAKKHILPINEDFLRESLRSIRFKYPKTITILGKITNESRKVFENRNIIDPQLAGLVDAANNFIEPLLLKSTQWITVPIALFFE